MHSKQFEEILAIQRQFSAFCQPMSQIQKHMNLASKGTYKDIQRQFELIQQSLEPMRRFQIEIAKAMEPYKQLQEHLAQALEPNKSLRKHLEQVANIQSLVPQHILAHIQNINETDFNKVLENMSVEAGQVYLENEVVVVDDLWGDLTSLQKNQVPRQGYSPKDILIILIMYLWIQIQPASLINVSTEISLIENLNLTVNVNFIDNRSYKKEIVKQVKRTLPQDNLSLLRFVIADELEVRTEPSNKSAVLDEIYRGKVVKILSKTKSWSLVEYSDVKTGESMQGWVFSRYLQRFS